MFIYIHLIIASRFNDEKLLQGIRLQCIISDSLLQVALGIFYQVAEGPEEFLEDDSSILDSWRHTVKHICDMPSDVFFILRIDEEKFRNICVQGAGLDQVNGIYQLYGQINGAASYTNGICFIVKIGNFWRIRFGYGKEGESFTVKRSCCHFLLHYVDLYGVESDTVDPDDLPCAGWRGRKCFLPPPTILPVYPE